MRTLSLAVLLVAAHTSFAGDEKTTIFMGDWSEVVNGVRGRLILAQGRTLGDSKIRESLAYVELENVANTHPGQVRIQFDPDALKCRLTDAADKAVPQAPVGGSGGRPGKTLVTLPFDSSVRLRANPFGFGRAEGLLIHLNTGSWHIKDAAEYYFSGTLTITSPEGNSWAGEIKFPKTKISLKPTLNLKKLAKPDGPGQGHLLVFEGVSKAPIHRAGPEHFQLLRVSDGKVVPLDIAYDKDDLDKTGKNGQREIKARARNVLSFNYQFHGVRLSLDTGPRDDKDMMEEEGILDLYGRAELEADTRYRLKWACWQVGATEATEMICEFVTTK
jgi:hypothetical protein